MPIHLKTLNVLSATSQPRNAVDAGDLYEYTFKTNVGNSFFDVLKALQIKSPC